MLPQGAPTSPIVSNMICLKLDISLLQIAKKYHVTYTRYADDITFSCNRKTLMENIIPLITDAINDNGFDVNIDKTRTSYKYNSQKITGLKVNEFLNVDRKYIRQLNSQLYAWDKHGYDNAQDHFSSKYDVKHRGSKKGSEFLNVLYGRLTFLKYIRGAENEIFIKLAKKFNTLFLKDHVLFKKIGNINKLTYNNTNDLTEKLFTVDFTDKDGFTSYGTAFILHEFPYLITCSHVVGKVKGTGYDNTGMITVINHKYQKEEVKLIEAHDHYDIAILELPDFLKNRYTLFNSSLYKSSFNDVERFQKIKYYGFPDYNFGDTYSKTEADITNIRVSSCRNYIEIDKTIKAGNSGGPVLLNDKVIGLCTNGDHTSKDMPNKIISIKEILEVLNSIPTNTNTIN